MSDVVSVVGANFILFVAYALLTSGKGSLADITTSGRTFTQALRAETLFGGF